MKMLRILIVPALAAALAACESGRSTPADVPVLAVHAAPSYLTANLLRVERVAGELEYGNVGSFAWDEDSYDISVEISPPGAASRSRVVTRTIDFVAGNRYYLIVAEVGGLIDLVAIEESAFDPDSADSEITFFNAGPELGAVDIYLEAPGADLATATPRAALDSLEHTTPDTLATGDYVLTLTAPGTPGTVLFRSSTLQLTAGQDNFFVLIDTAGQGLGAARVVRLNNSPTSLNHAELGAAVRAFNGAADRGDRDIIVEGDFANPLFAALPFATAVDYVDVASTGDVDLTITPAGDQGVLELEQEVTLNPGGYYSYLFTHDDNGELTGLLAGEDRRRIAATARLRIMNVASQFNGLDLLIMEPGTDPATASPQLALAAPAFSQRQAVAPGDYEIAARETGGSTVVAGPLPITLDARGLHTIVLVDGADPASADFVLLDDL